MRCEAMGVEIDYFAYGTLQKGFPNWPDLAHHLGDPIGRFRTVAPHALVVPVRAGCGNPGCGLLHRMATLVPGVDGFYVEGDLFTVDPDGLTAIDQLEDYDERREPPGLYVRTQVEVSSVSGDEVRLAAAYRVRDPVPWRALVADGDAEFLASYPRHLAEATAKQCCVRNPGHAGPHDVIDPLASVRCG